MAKITDGNHKVSPPTKKKKLGGGIFKGANISLPRKKGKSGKEKVLIESSM